MNPEIPSNGYFAYRKIGMCNYSDCENAGLVNRLIILDVFYNTGNAPLRVN